MYYSKSQLALQRGMTYSLGTRNNIKYLILYIIYIILRSQPLIHVMDKSDVRLFNFGSKPLRHHSDGTRHTDALLTE